MFRQSRLGVILVNVSTIRSTKGLRWHKQSTISMNRVMSIVIVGFELRKHLKHGKNRDIHQSKIQTNKINYH